jgi:hypothetical protein
MRQKGKGKLTEQKMQREIKRGRKWKSRIDFLGKMQRKNSSRWIPILL